MHIALALALIAIASPALSEPNSEADFIRLYGHEKHCDTADNIEAQLDHGGYHFVKALDDFKSVYENATHREVIAESKWEGCVLSRTPKGH